VLLAGFGLAVVPLLRRAFRGRGGAADMMAA